MRTALISLLGVLLLGACTNAERNETRANIPAGCVGDTEQRIIISDAWIREAAAGQRTSALYFSLCNSGDAADVLLGVRSPVAANLELHTTTRNADGVTQMTPSTEMRVDAGETITLKPGDAHVMLIGLSGALVAGEQKPVTLEFEHSAPITISAEIRALVDEVHGPH